MIFGCEPREPCTGRKYEKTPPSGHETLAPETGGRGMGAGVKKIQRRFSESSEGNWKPIRAVWGLLVVAIGLETLSFITPKSQKNLRVGRCRLPRQNRYELQSSLDLPSPLETVAESTGASEASRAVVDPHQILQIFGFA